MLLVKIERFSSVPYETDKVVFSTIMEWSDEDVTTFLGTIGAVRVHPASESGFTVWESEYPPFRVYVTKGFGE